MILGMSTTALTTLHVVITLIGIATGFIVAFGMIGARRLPLWNAVFLTHYGLDQPDRVSLSVQGRHSRDRDRRPVDPDSDRGGRGTLF